MKKPGNKVCASTVKYIPYTSPNKTKLSSRIFMTIPKFIAFNHGISLLNWKDNNFASRLSYRAYGEKGNNMRHKKTYIWAYLDGKKLCEVIQAALDNNMMVADMKQALIDENPGHEVTFKVVKK
jgi:hypothetical protein